MNEIKFTRKELYDLVWKEPILSISKRLNVSDYNIRKACKKMQIPLPLAGYWQKLQSKKDVSVKPLNRDYDWLSDVILEVRGLNQSEVESPLHNLIKEIQHKDKSYIVPDKLINPDKLIIAAQNSLAENVNRSSFKGVIRSGWQDIEIIVSQGNVNRALRFMDTIIKCLRNRGYSFEINGRYSYARIEDIKFRICCRDLLKKIITKSNYGAERTDLVSTGVLLFKIDFYQSIEWKDGKLLLEEQVPNILARIELEAQRRKKEAEEWRIERELWKKEDDIKREVERVKERELKKFNVLFNNVDEWVKMNNLKSYIEEIERLASREKYLSQDLLDDIAWAKDKLSFYKPLDKFLK